MDSYTERCTLHGELHGGVPGPALRCHVSATELDLLYIILTRNVHLPPSTPHSNRFSVATCQQLCGSHDFDTFHPYAVKHSPAAPSAHRAHQETGGRVLSRYSIRFLYRVDRSNGAQ